MRIKPLISFDMDGTLVKNNFTDKVWLEGIPKLYAKNMQVNLTKAKQKIFQDYDEIGNEQIEWYDLQYWLSKYNLPITNIELLEKFQHLIEVFPEVPDVIKRLHDKYELIIVSNAKKEFIDIQLKQTKLKHFFKNIFSSTSDFHEVRKSQQFYQNLCNKLSVKPTSLIHIGDNFQFDYRIPNNIGIKSFHLNRTELSKDFFIVHDLIEFEQKVFCLEL